MLPHLHNGWQVDQAILSEEDRVVIIRFGHDWDPSCMKMDEVDYLMMFTLCDLFSLPNL
jgi:DIM1 family U5 snRNP protein